MARNSSVSPVRRRAKSPPRRERSPPPPPPRQRSSNSEKLSSRNRSPKRDRSRSRSPVLHSSKNDKPSSHTSSPKRRKSPSSRTKSPKRLKSNSPPPRTRSPKRVKQRSSISPPPDKGKVSIQTKSPRKDRPKSPKPKSLSPRSKRLQRAKAGRNAEKEHENNHERKGDKATFQEKNSDRDRELPFEKKDRRGVRDTVDDGSSKSRRGREASPSDHHRKSRRRSKSPSVAESRERDELRNSRDSEQRNGDNDSVAKMKAAEETLEAKDKHKPSFELSGKLAEETNRFRGVTLLFNEPPDARKPEIRWRLYVFKGGEVLNEPLYVHRQTCYLFGRERRVADIPTDHPSCSKQHAVLQYRQVEEENPDGTMSKRVRPYLMDLGSTNGTFINDNQMEPQRYYELFEKDTIKFGNSSREYVILHENSA